MNDNLNYFLNLIRLNQGRVGDDLALPTPLSPGEETKVVYVAEFKLVFEATPADGTTVVHVVEVNPIEGRVTLVEVPKWY